MMYISFSEGFTLAFVDGIGAGYEMASFSYVDNERVRNLTVGSMEHCAMQCLGMAADAFWYTTPSLA